ncbi:MAG: NAD(P)/FAD-dependent oxidoreductase [Patescibacteria group bacterium]|nr:NAD(P)/FAD-dependent oxidoreductase [Patescibacteria group bacterium]
MRNIVILGAGFGGLKAAMVLGRGANKLAKRGYRVILVDKNDYHTYTPTLYEISTTSKETANYIDLKSVVTYPLKRILAKYNVQFIKDTVTKIDVRSGKVELLENDSLPYSHLIIALGAQTNYYNLDGLEAKSLTLKTFTDALNIRDAILDKAQSAKLNQEVNVVICGAGSTGVELAAELQEWFAELKREDVRCNMKTTLIDAAPGILGTLDKDVAEKAKRRLKKLGTNILTNVRVEKVRGDKINLSGDVRLRYDVLIWTAGIKINELLSSLPLKLINGRGVEVERTLKAKKATGRTKISGEVYIIGDAAAFKSPRSRLLVPQVARAAISEGSIAARNILRSLEGKRLIRFDPMQYPYVIPMGGKHAVAKLGPVMVSGPLGWILKGLIELNYLTSIMPLNQALGIWLKGLKIFIKNDRLG